MENKTATDFTTQASLAGKPFEYSLKQARSHGPVVVYFYPSAYTPGCNIQAHEFAKKIDKFKAAKASIIGVSFDSIERLNDFSADPEFCAGKVPVASDPKGTIAESFGISSKPEVPGYKDTRGVEVGHGFMERTTFVVSSKGIIVAKIGGVSPAENVENALVEVERLSAGN